MTTNHPAFAPGAVAVITGGASGIGLAAAKRLASLGLRVCIADLGVERLARARDEIVAVARGVGAAGGGGSGAAGAGGGGGGGGGGRGGAEGDVMVSETDVSRLDDLVALEGAVRARFGGTDVLMNNAGIQAETTALGPADAWQRVLDVNLWGVVHGTQVFVPGMLGRGRPGLVINTGSKQGITTPPGNPAYNVSKAGVKAYTEALQHELRNTPGAQLQAHLLIPGFVFTGLTAGTRTEKPAGAWTAEQTVDFMMERLAAGDFYILCPDNDVPRSLDERRILWAAGDIVENRPPLSRWHRDHSEAFARFAAQRAGG